MAFTPATHDYVGTDMSYAPRGFSPWEPHRDFGTAAGGAVLWAGERVSVLSAWTRDYLPGDAPELLYVQSHGTGERTHVVAADLIPAPHVMDFLDADIRIRAAIEADAMAERDGYRAE